MRSIDIANKAFNEKYGTDSPMEFPQFVRKFVRNKRCKSDLEIEDDICKNLKAHSSGDDSYIKRLFRDSLDNLGIDYVTNFQLNTFTYDVYLPDKNLLIQICPTNTHNNLFSFDEYGLGVSSMQHKAEAENAFIHDYNCIHIFDWDNIFNILNVLNTDSKKLGNVSVEHIDKSLFELFINQYSITDNSRTGKLYYGLFSNDDLVAVCSFKKSASKKYDWEIARYCEDTFIYSADRLIPILNRFIKENDPTSVVIYVDQSKYSGKELDKAGFKYVETLYPQRMWSKGIQKVLHNTIAGRTYDEVFHTNRNSKHSTYTQMIENGWLPVYDCGKKVYVR